MGRRRPESNPEKCLGFLAGYELYGKCQCGQERRLAIAPLARQFGGNTHFSYVGRLMVCRTCGHKGIELRPVRWDDDHPDKPLAY